MAGRDGPMAVEMASMGDAAVLLRASGELDAGSAPALRQALGTIEGRGARRVVVDLTEVTFMDSLSLAAIVGARTRLGANGRLAVAVEPGSYALLVLEATGLVGALDVFPTRDAAAEFALA
ncbi:MAG TPA: STAS domain-containing protein [Solirubrobacteraceae bacterium]|jgi:anti-sigma B factor antagonist|nr:STAS domain-containing protein [Solirubrobacteraceae bacterium]